MGHLVVQDKGVDELRGRPQRLQGGYPVLGLDHSVDGLLQPIL